MVYAGAALEGARYVAVAVLEGMSTTFVVDHVVDVH